MRSVSRVVDVSINTVTKLLAGAGEACEEFHAKPVRNEHSKPIECDEIWAFVYAKVKNLGKVKAVPRGWRLLDVDHDRR